MAAVLIVIYNGLYAGKAAHHVSELPAPRHPLFKPEPNEVLSNRALVLTKEQLSAIARVDSEWQDEKSRLLSEMRKIQPTRGRADQIAESLQDYSSLSREYDQTRERYWTKALSALMQAQLMEVRR